MKHIILLGVCVALVLVVGNATGIGQENTGGAQLKSIGTNIFLTNISTRTVTPGDIFRVAFDLSVISSNRKIKTVSVDASVVASTNGPLVLTFEDGSTEEVEWEGIARFDDFNSLNYLIPDGGVNRMNKPASEIDAFRISCEIFTSLTGGEFVWEGSLRAVTPPEGTSTCCFKGRAKADEIILILQFQIESENSTTTRSETVIFSQPVKTPEGC